MGAPGCFISQAAILENLRASLDSKVDLNRRLVENIARHGPKILQRVQSFRIPQPIPAHFNVANPVLNSGLGGCGADAAPRSEGQSRAQASDKSGGGGGADGPSDGDGAAVASALGAAAGWAAGWAAGPGVEAWGALCLGAVLYNSAAVPFRLAFLPPFRGLAVDWATDAVLLADFAGR